MVSTHLHAALPVYHFSERHSIALVAPAERVFAALRAVTAGEIFLFRTLTAIRRMGRAMPECILNPPADKPLLDVALGSGFHLIADDPPREVVIGMWVIPKRALAAMNFAYDGAVLMTETRIYTTDRGARLRFGAYWLLIRPGSAFIRRMWLRAIKRRVSAETPL
jgi:hypothetical protein